MVQSNVRLGSQLMGEDTVEFANSLGKAHREEIVVESKQVFTFVESLVSCCEGGKLSNAEQQRHQGIHLLSTFALVDLVDLSNFVFHQKTDGWPQKVAKRRNCGPPFTAIRPATCASRETK